MKKILESFLIVLALGLCALCTFQWYRESHLRKSAEGFSREIFQKKEVIQSLEDRLKRSEEDLLQRDQQNVELNRTIQTNKQELANLTKYAEKLDRELEGTKAQSQVYKEGFEQANANLKEQIEITRKQNDDMKKQNEAMKDLANRYTEVVEKYKELVSQFEKYQQDVQNANQAQKKEDQKK